MGRNSCTCGFDPNGLTLKNLIREFVEIGCKEARAEMAQEVVDILRAQAKKTISREALMALEAVEQAVKGGGEQ